MFKTPCQTPQANALAGDFAVIARIEASLAREGSANHSVSRRKPDFSRLRRYIPDLKV